MNHLSYKTCIELAQACATSCHHCATECLKEDDAKLLSPCISMDLECATVCLATSQLMALAGENALALCQVCAEICEACAEQCEEFGTLKHCRDCADICRKCAEECRSMVADELI